MSDNSSVETLPSGWSWTRLPEITVNLDSRRVPVNATEREKRIGLIPYYGATGQVGWINDYLFDEELVLLGEDGAPFLDTSKPKAYSIRGKAWVNNHAHVLRARSDVLDARYLLHFLNYTDYHGFATGTTRLKLTQSAMNRLPVKLAPLCEQGRIADEIETQLTRVDASVAALKRAQANLKRYRASVLKAACEGKLVPTEADLARAEGRDYEPAGVLLERILQERRARWEADQLAQMQAKGRPPKDDKWKSRYKEPAPPDTSDLQELPEGWGWCRAEQLSDFITKGTTPSAGKLNGADGEIPFIKVYNLTKGGFLDFSIDPTFVSRETHTKGLARSRVFPGDVLMNIVGPPLGKVSIVPSTFDEWNINQAIAVFRPLDGLEAQYLSITLLCEEILRWAIQRAKATAGQFNLTLEICRDLPIPLPPLVEQERIVAEVERRLSVIQSAEASVEANLKRAERLRQSILKQAFSGKLVPQDPKDEPASALLERIRAERETSPNPLRKRRGLKAAGSGISAPSASAKPNSPSPLAESVQG